MKLNKLKSTHYIYSICFYKNFLKGIWPNEIIHLTQNVSFSVDKKSISVTATTSALYWSNSLATLLDCSDNLFVSKDLKGFCWIKPSLYIICNLVNVCGQSAILVYRLTLQLGLRDLHVLSFENIILSVLRLSFGYCTIFVQHKKTYMLPLNWRSIKVLIFAISKNYLQLDYYILLNIEST